MPRKIAKESNDKLHFTLPNGASALLDQLVETQEFGGSHAEVVRYLVETQLHALRSDGTISRKPRTIED
jgi:Arc/MetJ-type ribon-helix-helix transcriptional regulator